MRRLMNLIVVTIAVAILNFGCAGQGPAEDAAGNPALAPGKHVHRTADGVRMPYRVAGKADADVTVVLVHCWMCDGSFFDRQLEPLAASYRTVTLDLPGHGDAGTDRESWTVAAYGDDVAGLIRERGLSDVVLVGHSMGGPVSLRVAALLPGTVRGIVAVDTLHDAEFEFDEERVEEFVRAFETDFVGTCEQFVDRMFPEEDADEVKATVTGVSCDERRSEIGTALIRDYADIDIPAWFRGADVPIRAINASEPTPTKIDLNRSYADFDAVLMDGAGHYLHMTRPEAFNEHLLEAIAEIVAADA